MQDYIAAGDAYHVNLSFSARFAFAGDALALYARLRSRAQAGHGAFIDDGQRHILSLSPELFFAVENGVLTARPMKGTAPRGADAGQDAQNPARLKASEKDRAENLMIVDLIRNDVGRVARTGTVKGENLFAVETHPTVHQMVSTVGCELRVSTSPADLVRALFSCGSVTGAPKMRAIEIIRELEQEPRGIYCGAIGGFSPDGSANFNVEIRTLTIEGAEGGSVSAAGSSWIPNPMANMRNASSRRVFRRGAAAFVADRNAPIRFRRRNRSCRSTPRATGALRCGIWHRIRQRRPRWKTLHDAMRDQTGPSRVWLQLNEDGSLEMSCHPFVAPAPDTCWTYRISPRRVQSGDCLLRHKTSWRESYDEDHASANRMGCDEVIYLNERDELVEGSSTNIFVRIAGRLLTPATSSGPVDGCLKRALVEIGECTEKVLYLSDLENSEVYLGNSLRGLIRAAPLTR